MQSVHELLPTSLWLSDGMLQPNRSAAAAADATAITARLAGTREYKYLLYFVGKVNR